MKSIVIPAVALVMLFGLLACTRIDEAQTPTAETVPSVTNTTELATRVPETVTQAPVVLAGTPVPLAPTSTPPPPTPTRVPIEIQYECAVGLLLEPGEACSYLDENRSNFVLAVRGDGSTLLDGSVGPLWLIDRTVEPGDKVCVCGLTTESDGLNRTITALPQPIPTFQIERFVLPPSPYLGQCVVGMDVETGELCWYPRERLSI